MLKRLIVILSLGFSPLLYGNVDVSGRHVFVIHAGVDTIWGSYLFMVANLGSSDDTLEMRMMLPDETQDWAAQDGLNQEDLVLGESGGVALKKSFPPGDSLLAIGFKTQGSLGEAELTFKPPMDMSKVVIMARKGTLKLSGEGFTFATDVEFSDAMYDTLSRGPVAKGDVLKIKVEGVPEGRTRLWYIGGISFAVMSLSAMALTLMTRGRVKGNEGA